MNKAELRKEIKQRHALHRAERATLSQQVVTQVLAEEHLQTTKVVLLYYSLPDEVETEGLIGELLQRGKKVLLPMVQGKEMVVVEVNKNTQYHIGSFGIKEPEALPYCGTIDVAIVPGVAFDKEGNRLGRGKGYYDRFLSTHNCYKIGICFAYQVLELLPHEPHDVKMDKVITA